jgi:3-dehydroquinate dehydratase
MEFNMSRTANNWDKVHKREEFRHRSCVSLRADGVSPG